ncbi:MAG: DUF1667 domain-containing protein [Clostridia bacterium]|nr:DUF1667 domain-containing protein [Clostridia bacterium]
MKKTLTCIECPIGCTIEVEFEGEQVLSVKGNACLRGKAYASSEVVCPKRVLTSTVRAENGGLVPVKTSEPIPKDQLFAVMEKINAVVCKLPVKIGDVIVENICDGADLIATNSEE